MNTGFSGRERLHRAWLHRLRVEWAAVNDECLEGGLRPPSFAIDQGKKRVGRWEPRSRILGISEDHIWDQPWAEVLQTLRHEMAHQAAGELLEAAGEKPHGPSFRRACEMLDVDPAASGTSGKHAPSEADRILQKVRKLMALATSANVHEAEAAMAAANTLLLKYNLSLPTGQDRPGYGYRQVGRSAAALALHWKIVGNILEEFFFVECIWVGIYNARKDRLERTLEICGTDANLDFAEHVHDFLHGECERLWALNRRAVSGGRSRKREYVTGLLSGFKEKLRAERHRNQERGLIWVGDPGLQGYFHDRHPRVSALGSGGVYLTGAYEAGQEAGRKLTIHKPVRQRGGKGGKLLE